MPTQQKNVVDMANEGGVLWLTMNRPEALNALSGSLVSALQERFAAAARDPEVGVIVLTGAGRAFCAGADLKEAESRGAGTEASAAFLRTISGLTDAMELCPKPIIAAVNGVTVAGGLELMLACDFVVAAASARLGDGHSNYGLFPGAGATVRLPRMVGVAMAKYLMFSGELIPARDAQAIGLVQAVAEDEAFRSTVAALAQRLAAKSPLLLGRMKEAISDAPTQPHGAAMRRERDLSQLYSASFDRAEGLAAFREKRAPRFQGR